LKIASFHRLIAAWQEILFSVVKGNTRREEKQATGTEEAQQPHIPT